MEPSTPDWRKPDKNSDRICTHSHSLHTVLPVGLVTFFLVSNLR